MGTRSCTNVYDYDGKPIVSMYRQYDGYYSGHGQELADFIAKLTLVNGLSGDTTNLANGPGCLAAQIVAHFKTLCGAVGGIYLYPPNEDNSQEYNYDVHCDGDLSIPGTIRLVASHSSGESFDLACSRSMNGGYP